MASTFVTTKGLLLARPSQQALARSIHKTISKGLMRASPGSRHITDLSSKPAIYEKPHCPRPPRGYVTEEHKEWYGKSCRELGRQELKLDILCCIAGVVWGGVIWSAFGQTGESRKK